MPKKQQSGSTEIKGFGKRIWDESPFQDDRFRLRLSDSEQSRSRLICDAPGSGILRIANGSIVSLK
jgi:hypothetical protein